MISAAKALIQGVLSVFQNYVRRLNSSLVLRNHSLDKINVRITGIINIHSLVHPVISCPVERVEGDSMSVAVILRLFHYSGSDRDKIHIVQLSIMTLFFFQGRLNPNWFQGIVFSCEPIRTFNRLTITIDSEPFA